MHYSDLYDNLCADRLTLMTYECEHFFRRGSKRWSLSQIPDPQDTDLVRYSVLASLVEALVDVFVDDGGGRIPAVFC
jgi:hypothetical protein